MSKGPKDFVSDTWLKDFLISNNLNHKHVRSYGAITTITSHPESIFLSQLLHYTNYTENGKPKFYVEGKGFWLRRNWWCKTTGMSRSSLDRLLKLYAEKKLIRVAQSEQRGENKKLWIRVFKRRIRRYLKDRIRATKKDKLIWISEEEEY